MTSTAQPPSLTANSDRSPHPFVYLILFLPFGIVAGYLTVTLAYLFSKAGIYIEQIAILVSFSYVPQMLKFLWAPFVDVTFTVKNGTSYQQY